MRRKIIGIFVCMLLIGTVIPVVGQVKDISLNKENDEISPLSNGDKWIKTFDFTPFDGFFSVQQTSDGGYITVGATKHPTNNYDVWLVKTDSQGDIMWDKKFGGAQQDYCSKVKQTSDGGYILMGATDFYSDVNAEILLIKTDTDGNKLWDKTFGDIGSDYGYDVQQTDDGGYIISGTLQTLDKANGWLIKTDSNGNMIWNKTYKDSDFDAAYSVVQALDGGYIVTGGITNPEGTDVDLWLFKTDSNGELLWEKTLGDNQEIGNSMQITDDGGYIITGVTAYSDTFISRPYVNMIISSQDIRQEDVLLMKTDSEGELQWDKKIGKPDYEYGYSVQQTSDNGYIIAGVGSDGIKYTDALLIKTNSEGQEEWRKTFGGYNYDEVYSVQQTSDGGYILTGFKSTGLYRDLWLIKTDSNGDVPTSRARNLLKFRLFELFPNLFPILQMLFQRLGLQ